MATMRAAAISYGTIITTAERALVTAIRTILRLVAQLSLVYANVH